MLAREQKQRLKEQRLQDYAIQMFNLQMTKAAYEAVGEMDRVQECERELIRLQQAYEAVERFPIDE